MAINSFLVVSSMIFECQWHEAVRRETTALFIAVCGLAVYGPQECSLL